ncbi:MAG: acyltransferase, partial [Bdellovibrionota bacterium]
MISFLPQFVRGVLGLSLFILNTAFWCVFIYSVAIVKLLVPIRVVRRTCTDIMVIFGEFWIDGNDFL